MRSTSPAGAQPHPRAVPDLRECKIRASLLLKALQSDDRIRALAAVDRFRALPKYAELTPERLLAWRDQLRRKHALAVIATEAGFTSWTELRAVCDRETIDVRADIDRLFENGAMYLNHWSGTYEEARAILDQAGGYLFPYRSQFVVCPAGKLEAHGVDAFDPDWARIGFDWVEPNDRAAFRRLNARLVAVLGREEKSG